MSPQAAALGFRVKSGFAISVLLGGTRGAPELLDCRKVQLADPAVPDSTQPWHAGLDLPKGEAARVVARLVLVVEKFSERSLRELLELHRVAGHRLRGVALVVGSEIEPATIANEHIRAHAEEGRLFRAVIESAAKRARLPTRVLGEKRLYAEATRALKQGESRLKERLSELGRGVDGRWRAEEKGAALAAWLALD